MQSIRDMMKYKKRKLRFAFNCSKLKKESKKK